MSDRPLRSSWCAGARERVSAMAIVASMTLPAFGIRTYRTRYLEDGYEAEEPKDRAYAALGPNSIEYPKDIA